MYLEGRNDVGSGTDPGMGLSRAVLGYPQCGEVLDGNFFWEKANALG